MNDDTKRLEAERYIVPPCSIDSDEGTVTVTLELPGVEKDAVEIKIDGNELAITGRRAAAPAEGTYLLRERRRGDYRKIFTIDDSISREEVDAALADGLLTLTLHLKEAAKPRRIEIA